MISTPAVQGEIAAAGLTGRVVLSGGDEAISAIVDPPHSIGSHPLRLHAQLKANLALCERVRDELLAAWSASPPALVIADFAVPVAARLRSPRGIRWWTAVRIPCALETPDGPPGYSEAGARVLGRWVASAMRPGVR